MSACLEEGAVGLDKPLDFSLIEISQRFSPANKPFAEAMERSEDWRVAEVPGHRELTEDENWSTDQSP